MSRIEEIRARLAEIDTEQRRLTRELSGLLLEDGLRDAVLEDGYTGNWYVVQSAHGSANSTMLMVRRLWKSGRRAGKKSITQSSVHWPSPHLKKIGTLQSDGTVLPL